MAGKVGGAALSSRFLSSNGRSLTFPPGKTFLSGESEEQAHILSPGAMVSYISGPQRRGHLREDGSWVVFVLRAGGLAGPEYPRCPQETPRSLRQRPPGAFQGQQERAWQSPRRHPSRPPGRRCSWGACRGTAGCTGGPCTGARAGPSADTSAASGSPGPA